MQIQNPQAEACATETKDLAGKAELEQVFVAESFLADDSSY
jgi:hypothetical protein